MQYNNSWKTRGACLAMSYGIFFLMRGFINQTLFDLLYNNTYWKLTGNLVMDFVLFFVILMIPVALVHEWIHGIVYKLFGGSVKFSLKGIYFCAYEKSKLQIHRTKYLVMLMTPAVVISLLSLLIPGWVGGMIFMLNLFKSTGDLIKAAYLCRTNSTTYIVDFKNGFEASEKQESVQLTFENL